MEPATHEILRRLCSGIQFSCITELTEIRDLVAKYRSDHTSGTHKKAEIRGRETVGSKRPERLCRRLAVFLIQCHTPRERAIAHSLGRVHCILIILRVSRISGGCHSHRSRTGTHLGHADPLQDQRSEGRGCAARDP